jgi:chemotaxis protein methyltransferase WspC
MALAHFESLLKKAIGLDAATVGRSAIEQAIRERETACRMADRAAYWEHVRSSESELQALIDAVVVPETWFGRERDAFTALAAIVRAKTAGLMPAPQARVLSLPCSTGEEPYAMVMSLLDASLPPQRFQVDAIDVSHRSLRHARHGVYGKSSFRGTDQEWRARYFESTPEGHRLVERVRARVSFKHGNLLHPSSLPGSGIYDAIFCRNVLIYFDRVGQDLVTAVLSRLLAPSGVLFVGAAESAVVSQRGFTSARIPRVAAFRKTAAGAHAHAINRVRPTIKSALSGPVVPPLPPISSASVEQPTFPVSAHGLSSNADLDEGIRLANAGRFEEAAARYEQCLRTQGPSAQLFHLLGLVRDAAGRHADAVGYYKRALYLDPQHHETLVHLALLMDAQNNRAEAERLRLRARRDADRRGSTRMQDGNAQGEA